MGKISHVSSRRALVVGPDLRLRQKCSNALEGAGFLVNFADSGFGAVVAAREVSPNLIFVDMALPDVPARDAITWLRANPLLLAAPIIVFAARNDDELGLGAIQPDAVLRKPISSAMIHHTIVDLFLSGARRNYA